MLANLTDFLNFSESKDHAKMVYTVDCKILNVVGGYYIFLFLISCISNIWILWILIKNKMLLQHANLLLFAVAILSLIGTFIELPLIIVTSFKCKYVVRKFKVNLVFKFHIY